MRGGEHLEAARGAAQADGRAGRRRVRAGGALGGVGGARCAGGAGGADDALGGGDHGDAEGGEGRVLAAK